MIGAAAGDGHGAVGRAAVTAVTVSASPSGSVSLASTSIGRWPADVLGVGGGVVDRDRGVVDRGDIDRDGGGVGAAVPSVTV